MDRVVVIYTDWGKEELEDLANYLMSKGLALEADKVMRYSLEIHES